MIIVGNDLKKIIKRIKRNSDDDILVYATVENCITINGSYPNIKTNFLNMDFNCYQYLINEKVNSFYYDEYCLYNSKEKLSFRDFCVNANYAAHQGMLFSRLDKTLNNKSYLKMNKPQKIQLLYRIYTEIQKEQNV